MNVAWNGSVVQADQAVISPYDHGFLYGIGLFETFRTYGGRPYLLDRHLDRLAAGCRDLGIRYVPDAGRLQALLDELLRSNGLDDAYVRLTVSAGDEGLGLPAGDYGRPNEVVMVKALPAQDPELYESGRELRLLRTRRNSPEGDIRLKSLHYMNNILAKRELAASGAPPGSEGLLLDRDGRLAEGIVSNLFFVPAAVSAEARRRVCTPAVSTGILPGITRGRVLELAAEAGYETEEGLYGWDDLLAAEEIWLTGSVQELVPVTRLSNPGGGGAVIVGDGTAGSVTRELLRAYRSDIRANTAADKEGDRP